MIGALVVFLLWLGLVGGMLVGWVFALIAIWRAMKAHESIAESVRRISEKLDHDAGA
jgi:hypothetical protein